MGKEISKNPRRLTIVVPVRDRADIVGRTLASIEAQTYRPLDVILVDNGSIDGTADVLAAWADKVRGDDMTVTVLSEPVAGACRARNAGLDRVETEWTMFFDSDDVMQPSHVETAMRSATEDADIVAWNLKYIYGDGRHRTNWFYTSNVWYNNVFHSSFSTQRYMARTELFRRAGGWNNSCRMFDDAELGMRMLRLNPRIRHTGTSDTVTVYSMAGSIINNPTGRIRSMRPALAEMARTMPPEMRHWPALMGILSALTWAKDDPESEAYVSETLSETKGVRRLLWRLFALYTRLGGRGVAYLYKPFKYW